MDPKLMFIAYAGIIGATLGYISRVIMSVAEKYTKENSIANKTLSYTALAIFIPGIIGAMIAAAALMLGIIGCAINFCMIF